MHKTLDPKTHGVIDYLIVVLLFLAPMLFGFAGTIAATICYVLAVAQGGMSLITRYPLSIAKIIPFPIHGGIELAAGIFLILSPFLFRFTALRGATWFFILSGVAVGIVYMLTNYRVAPQDARAPEHGATIHRRRHA